MSMSTRIKGIASKEKMESAKKIVEECEKIGIYYPEELDEILDEEIELPIKKYSTDSEEIWEIKVTDIPKNVEAIQLIHSY